MSIRISQSLSPKYNVSFGNSEAQTDSKANNFVNKNRKAIYVGSAVGLAAATTATALAYTRGKTVNNATGKETTFFSNVIEGFKTFVGKGKAAYDGIINKKDNVPVPDKAPVIQPTGKEAEVTPEADKLNPVPEKPIQPVTGKEGEAIQPTAKEGEAIQQPTSKDSQPVQKETEIAPEKLQPAADETVKIFSGNWRERIETMGEADKWRIPESGLTPEVQKALDSWNPELISVLNDEDLSCLLMQGGTHSVDREAYVFLTYAVKGLAPEEAQAKLQSIYAIQGGEEKAKAFAMLVGQYNPELAQRLSTPEEIERLAQDQFATYLEAVGKNFTAAELNETLHAKVPINNGKILWCDNPGNIVCGRTTPSDAIAELLMYKRVPIEA